MLLGCDSGPWVQLTNNPEVGTHGHILVTASHPNSGRKRRLNSGSWWKYLLFLSSHHQDPTIVQLSFPQFNQEIDGVRKEKKRLTAAPSISLATLGIAWILGAKRKSLTPPHNRHAIPRCVSFPFHFSSLSLSWLWLLSLQESIWSATKEEEKRGKMLGKGKLVVSFSPPRHHHQIKGWKGNIGDDVRERKGWKVTRRLSG